MSADVNRRTALGLAGALTGALAGSVATGARAQTGGDPFAITRVRAHLDVLERGGDLRTGEPGERALTEYLAAQLTAAGFEVATGVGGHGFGSQGMPKPWKSPPSDSHRLWLCQMHAPPR